MHGQHPPEVPLDELVLLHLQATLNDLHCLLPPHGHVHRDLFVTTDREGTDGVPGCAYRAGQNSGETTGTLIASSPSPSACGAAPLRTTSRQSLRTEAGRAVAAGGKQRGGGGGGREVAPFENTGS